MGEDWRSWEPLAQQVHSSWRVSAPDLPWRSLNDQSWHSVKPPVWWIDRALASLIEAGPERMP
jgi:hypothetical protein